MVGRKELEKMSINNIFRNFFSKEKERKVILIRREDIVKRVLVF